MKDIFCWIHLPNFYWRAGFGRKLKKTLSLKFIEKGKYLSEH